MAENDDHPERSTPTTEGVRILGAQEASAIEAERRAAMGEEDATEALPVTHADPDPVVEHAERAEPADDRTWAEMTSDDGPTWSASDADAAEPAAPSAEHDTGELDGPSWLEPDYAPPVDTPVDTPVGAVTTGEVEALPHWSEPPTGQVPVVGVDDTGSSPRFRDTGDDWSDSDVAVLSDDSSDDERLGAMSGREPPQPADDDETFVAQVRARRRSGTRAVVTSTPEARPMPRPGGRRAGAGAGVGGPAAAAPAAASGAGDVLPSSGRDLPVALLTAVIFGAVAVIAFTLGQTWTALLAAVVIAICGFELCAILQAKGLRPATLPVVVACAAAPLVPLKGPNVTTSVGAAAGMGPFAILFALVTVVSFVWFLWRVGPGRPVIGVAISVMVFCYVGGLGGYAGLLLQRGPDGVGLLFGTVLVVVAYDVVGYFAGSRLGSAPIAPNTSPGKTVEGTLAGVIASLLVAILLLPHLTPWKGHKVLVLAATGLLLGVAALVGDLCESMLKRDLGVKDFGTLLPGHGGFLDRFDGLLFALPVAYYVTLHLKMF